MLCHSVLNEYIYITLDYLHFNSLGRENEKNQFKFKKNISFFSKALFRVVSSFLRSLSLSFIKQNPV